METNLAVLSFSPRYTALFLYFWIPPDDKGFKAFWQHDKTLQLVRFYSTILNSNISVIFNWWQDLIKLINTLILKIIEFPKYNLKIINPSILQGSTQLVIHRWKSHYTRGTFPCTRSPREHPVTQYSTSDIYQIVLLYNGKWKSREMFENAFFFFPHVHKWIVKIR